MFPGGLYHAHLIGGAGRDRSFCKLCTGPTAWWRAVSISEQKMYVYRHGTLLHEWPVSTARPGKITPTGQWRPATFVKASPFQPLQQCTHALCDFLFRALRDPWHRSSQPPGPSGLCRLRAAGPGKCQFCCSTWCARKGWIRPPCDRGALSPSCHSRARVIWWVRLSATQSLGIGYSPLGAS